MDYQCKKPVSQLGLKDQKCNSDMETTESRIERESSLIPGGLIEWADSRSVHPLLRPDRYTDGDNPTLRPAHLQHKPLDVCERVVELTRTNGALLQILATHKDSQRRETEFANNVSDIYSGLRDILQNFDQFERGQLDVLPLFQTRPDSDRAGTTTILDDQIVSHGGTTSTYEELPQRLQDMKSKEPPSLMEREQELIDTNKSLLEELKYHTSARKIESGFKEGVSETRDELEAIRLKLDNVWSKRIEARREIASIWLGYWGIQRESDDVEATVF